MANSGQSNKLYRNDGNGQFTDIAASAGVDDSDRSAGVVFLDVDGDGDLDLYVPQERVQ